MLLEDDEVLKLDVNELVCNYQIFGVRVAVKYGLCKAIKTAYNRFMVSFIDTYDKVSLKTSVVDSNDYNNVIISSNKFTEILEEYYYSVAPATNFEVGDALLDVIDKLFIKCVEYVEKQTSYYI